jgi:mRNA-degrading endonuclease RelE of RelBE toxin-antitoxin system
LDPPVRTRVVRELERLAEQGPGKELVRLKGRPGSRLRIGDWRAIVELDEEVRTILVKRVLPRGRAYER